MVKTVGERLTDSPDIARALNVIKQHCENNYQTHTQSFHV